MKIITSVAVLLFILGGIVYFFQPQIFFTKKEITPVTVRLAWLHQAQFAGFYVAKEKGYYTDVGLDVSLKEFDFAVDNGVEIAENKVDFSIASSQELISYIDKGLPLKGVAVIYQTSPYAFASLKNRNIETPADFRGKKLGIAGGNQQAKVTYAALLNQSNIPATEVTYKELGFDTPEDIITEQADVVDLYRTDQTFILNERNVSYNLLFPEQFDFNMYGDVIIATNDSIEKRPELVQAFVEATLKGWEYALKHQEEAVALVGLYDTESYDNPKYEAHILRESSPLIIPHGNQRIGDMRYEKWKKTVNAMKSSKVIKPELEAKNVFTTEFIQ